MRIVVVGAGFTGLTAAYHLLKAGHQVVVIEREPSLGGLATGYKHKGWKWSLDKAYHHLFTNDMAAVLLARQIGQPLNRITPKTCMQTQGEILPFDSALSLLRFPYLGFLDKIRTGLAIAYLKITGDYQSMEKIRAIPWIKKYMGERSYNAIWEPLFRGKFHDRAQEVMLPWFWARIKKRTQSLLYPEGGFTAFLDKLAREVVKMGGEIKLSTPVSEVRKAKSGYTVVTDLGNYLAERVIYTGPTQIFPKLFGQPLKPKRKPHQYLSAQVLVLRLKKALLKGTYWLNITDPTFPFLVLVDHTNFVSRKNYGNEHIVYIGNYLPPSHPYLKLSNRQLLSKFAPYIEKISHGFKDKLIGSDMFVLPYAQAIVNSDYIDNTRKNRTGMKGVYMANIDSIYPWDRGTNYAIEKGTQLASEVMDER